MRHRLLSGVPVLALALLPLGAGCEGSPTELYELSGEITDERTRDPIGGARVVFTSDTGYSNETTTDDSGLYRLTVETDHPFGQVRAEAAGYVADEESVYFDSQFRRIDIALRPGGGGSM